MAVLERLAGLNGHFASLVHLSARGDVISRYRHQSFIASHLLGGGLALIVFPVYAVAQGGLSPAALAVFAWFLSPIAIALFLSATGRLATAHLVSAANLAAVVTVVAGLTGGLTSFVVPWMVIVPLEAALSNDRRVIFASIAIACVGLLALAIAGTGGFLPAGAAIALDPGLLALLGVSSALVYAGGLAISIQLVHTRSADAIRHGERRYRLIADNATDLITRHDADGEIVFASPAAERVVGASATALTETGLVDAIHPADRTTYRSTIARCLSEAKPSAIEFRLYRDEEADEEERWAEMRLQPVVRQQGADTDDALVGVTRDITASKRQAIDLLRARDDAESASRAKTQFLATMSHELRTPLNAIIGFADILSRELFGAIGEARYREYAGLIHESGEHLLSVVNEILDMSKIEAGKYSIVKEPVDIADLLRSSCEIMRHGAQRKSITLSFDMLSDLAELDADKRACKQMLLNLLSNAIKFTEDGGEVRVVASRAKDMLHIQVIDNGIGIAPQDLPTLGTPFVQAETSYARKFDGAGLGLCVVSGLAKLHGGSLHLESELGAGTTVTIALPMPRIPRERLSEDRDGALETFAAASGM